MSATERNELSQIIEGSGLPAAKATLLIEQLSPLVEKAGELSRQASAIAVTDATQVSEMKQARRVRLEMREVRVAAEKVRKDLKADVLSMGRAIDAVGKWLAGKIEPEESRLLECETFAERAEAARKESLRVSRAAALAPLGVDCSAYQLGDMTEAAFAQLLDGSRLAHQARIDRERKEAEERAAAEKARLEEEQRIRAENERLRREAEAAARAKREADAKAAKERAELERKLADERRVREQAERQAREAAERAAQQEREQAEAEAARSRAEKAAARKAAAAPDRQKLVELARSLRELPIPAFKTEEAAAVGAELKRILGELATGLENQAVKIGGSSLVATRVTRPAAPVGRNPDACTNELATDNEPHTECDACRVGGEA